MNVLLDTSAVIAILNKKDKHHEEAIKTLHQERERGDRLLMTNFLLAETYGLINLRLAPRLARRWLKENNTRVERITPTDEMQAEKILLEHEDKPSGTARSTISNGPLSSSCSPSSPSPSPR